MTGPRVHRCHVPGCDVAVRPELLTCRRHWHLVPKPLQLAVWRSYRAGQCDDKRPSRGWVKAARAAIRAAQRAEREAARRAPQQAFEWG